jgi:hypothetical protein
LLNPTGLCHHTAVGAQPKREAHGRDGRNLPGVDVANTAADARQTADTGQTRASGGSARRSSAGLALPSIAAVVATAGNSTGLAQCAAARRASGGGRSASAIGLELLAARAQRETAPHHEQATSNHGTERYSAISVPVNRGTVPLRT